MRVSGMRVLSVVRWLAAALAALLVLAVAVPSAWAEGNEPTVTLNAKTDVSVGDASTNATYKFGGAVVSGDANSYIAVQVDSGWFSLASAAPTGAKASAALNQNNEYVSGDAVGVNGTYKYVTFTPTDSEAGITADNLQSFLRGLTFTLDGNSEQEVTVSFTSKPLKASFKDTVTYGSDEYAVTLYNGNAYTFIQKPMSWENGYKAAKSTEFYGKQGHLLTIESAAEHNLIYKAFNNYPGWMGMTSYTTADQAKENGDTFDINAHKGEAGYYTAWYWVTGPSAGTKTWTANNTSGGPASADVYVNWSANEPSAGTEGCAQYGSGALGQWNDLPNTWNGIENERTFGFYVEYEDYSTTDAVSEVSATTQRVNVTYDLDGGNVTSTTNAAKALANTEYSTTLGAAEGHTLDTSSVKVTVGGTELTADTDYTFNKSTGKLTVPAEKVTGDVEVSAKALTGDVHTVTFVVGTGGTSSIPSSLKVADGTKISDASGFVQPDVTAKEGKRFTGWLSSVDGVDDRMYNPDEVGDVEVTSDMTFTAQYKDLVKVTFNYGGGEDEDGETSVSSSGVKDEKYDVPDGKALSRAGYTFDAWSPVPSGTFGASDETFTAQWTANTYTVVFDKNGGTGEMSDQSFTYDEVAKALSENKFERAGYTFKEWKDEAANKTYTNKQEVQNLTAVNGGTVTLKAQWTPNENTEYKVKHYLQNANDDGYTLDADATQTKTGTTGAETKAAENSYTGFAVKEFAQKTISGDGTTVVEIYYTRNTYDVTFDAEGHGDTPTGLTGVRYGAAVADPGALSADGWSFGGWYSDESFAEGKKWDFSKSTMPDENLTLFAKWTANTYTVAFDKNGGKGDMPVQSFTYDTAQALPRNLFTRDGYTFKGWTLSEDGSGTLYADGESVMNLIDQVAGARFARALLAGPAADVTLYAQWTGNEYNITYDPAGGTLPADAPKKHTYGTETKLPTPSKDGYTFDGWYDENGKKIDKIPADAKDTKVTAKWSANTSDITYDADGGTLPDGAPKKHEYGTETKLPTPTRDGYTFDGWYDEDGNKVDTIPADAKGTKVTAKWSANEYDITYDPDGGTLPADAPKKHTYGTETKLPTPTRDGYTFDGWYDEDGNKVDTIPADAKGMKVTARWTKNADSADNGNGGVTYDPNGGAMPEGWTGADGRLPVPTRDGYRFDGWYDEDGNLVTSLEDAAGKTLHARWAKLDTLASTGATALAVGLTALALAAVGVTVAALRRKRSR